MKGEQQPARAPAGTRRTHPSPAATGVCGQWPKCLPVGLLILRGGLSQTPVGGVQNYPVSPEV